MRHINFFAGLAVLTLSVSTINAQIMNHSGGSGHQTSVASGRVYTSSPATTVQSAPQSMPAQSAPEHRVNNAPQTTPAVSNAGFSSRHNGAIAIPNRDRDFDRDRDRDGDRDRDRDRIHNDFRHRIQGVVPVGGYIYTDDEYPNNQDNNQQPQQQYVEQETPAPTIFENRPGYTAPPVRAYQPLYLTQQTQSDGGVQRISAVEPQGSTILVFRDGHMLEIGNYVTVHDGLYIMDGDSRTHKIMLSDLDLDKTIKINQERGNDFKLPKS